MTPNRPLSFVVPKTHFESMFLDMVNEEGSIEQESKLESLQNRLLLNDVSETDDKDPELGPYQKPKWIELAQRDQFIESLLFEDEPSSLSLRRPRACSELKDNP